MIFSVIREQMCVWNVLSITVECGDMYNGRKKKLNGVSFL